MRVFYCDNFGFPLPPGHRFPLNKYTLLREQVAASQVARPDEMLVPDAATDEQLLRAHSAEYLQRVFSGQLAPAEVRRIGLPWSPELIERCRRSAGATIAACRAALEEGMAASLTGGTHHAFADHGEGYCIFNDSAVAARAMQAEGRATRVLVVDCDVHQGNGTAAICASDPSIYTFSIHGAKNFPFRKESSDLDIELPDGTDDALYLETLARGLECCQPAARADLIIYLAGADPYQGDALGRLNLSKEGLAQRDRLVFESCRRIGVPCAVAMAGGYARCIQDTVDIYLQTVRLAYQYATGRS
jgi:acetoin utilization deacetylase AcuC-like enzyme